MAKRVGAVKQGCRLRGGDPAGTGRTMNERDDQKRVKGLRGRAGRMRGGRGSGRAGGGQVRFWGHHAVEAALKNPDRVHRKLWATREAVAELDGELPANFTVEYASAADLARLVAHDAPHQIGRASCRERVYSSV